jgi:hypothetical protein
VEGAWDDAVAAWREQHALADLAQVDERVDAVGLKIGSTG